MTISDLAQEMRLGFKEMRAQLSELDSFFFSFSGRLLPWNHAVLGTVCGMNTIAFFRLCTIASNKHCIVTLRSPGTSPASSAWRMFPQTACAPKSAIGRVLRWESVVRQSKKGS
jgi:hypothetical protein